MDTMNFLMKLKIIINFQIKFSKNKKKKNERYDQLFIS